MISHEGTVVRVDGGRYDVRVEPIAACNGCKAKGSCGSNGESKVITVVDYSGVGIELGDRVVVSVRTETALYATFFAYIAPLMIFVGSIVIGSITIGDEGVAALISFVMVGIYYVSLYAVRRSVERSVRFEIKKKK